jgi:hypothetical protein
MNRIGGSKSLLMASLLATAFGGMGMGMDYGPRTNRDVLPPRPEDLPSSAVGPETRKKRVCGNPLCGKETPRDYCSAECCKSHRKQQWEKTKAEVKARKGKA